MLFDQIKDEVQRRASGVAVGVVQVSALEGDRAEEGFHGDWAILVDDFAGQRRDVVRDELAVIEKILDDAAGFAGEGVAQAGF